MNIMKKKPELLKKTGKSSQTLRKFVNNLKENDLHYENKQITQCVFLGVLRLKPVPSIFSNKVSSVSTTVESSKPKKVKNNNSNRELNKNASKKHNINKVLSGKVSKKNPEKVKAAVKKVPTKKPNIKIKLNSKKKINEAEPSTSNGKQETLPSGTSSTVSPDSIIARSTLTLNPVVSPTKFNPVQNLFEKLKQRREESQNEAGPSKITALSSKTREVLKSDETKFKVCKINANGRNTPLSCKKLKKSCKKSHERLTLPLMSTSPITVSDTESVGKKDSDIILLDENNSNNGDSSDNGIVEDIIIINDDSRPKSAESTLEKEISNQEIIDKRIQNNSTSTLTNVNPELAGTSQCQEVIVISDEPKQTNKSEDINTRSEKNEDTVHVTSKSDVIVIDEVREIRVSPRLKKIEEKAKEITANAEKAVADEVVVVPDKKNISSKVPKILQGSVDISKTQELNITIENRQTENKKLKTSPRLLKIADASKDISVTVKKELIEEVMVVNEKPKRRKNTMRSPTLPPMLLNAPMLLRSELAPKKPNYVNEKPRVRKFRNKIKDSNLKSAIPVIELVKNISRDESTKLLNKNSKTLQLEKETSRLDQGYSSPGIKHSIVSTPSECDIQSDGLLSDEIVCVDDSKHKNTDGRGIIKKLHVTQHKNVNKVKIEELKETTCKHLTQNESSQDSSSKMCDNKSVKDIIVLNDELTKSELKNKNQKIKIFNRKPVSEVSVHKEEDIVFIKEENNSKEKISPRLLRSDLIKQKKFTEVKNINSPVTEKIESEVNEFINLIDTSDLGKRISPRTLRSNIIKKGPTNRDSSAENTIVIKDEEVSALNETFEKLPETEKSQQKIKKMMQNTKQANLDEIIIVNDRRVKIQREKYSGRLLRSELSQLNAKEKLPVKTELEEVIVLIHDEPKDKQKLAVLPLQSNATSSDHIENVIVVPEEERNQAEVRSPRSLRSDRIRKVNAVTSPKPRTSRMVKMENDSLPNSSLDQQLPVDDLVIILQTNSEQMENVIVVPDDQIKVQSPRSLRSDKVRKVNLEVTSSKSKTSKIGKMESNFIPNVSTNQHDVIPQRSAEQMGSVILVPDERKNETEVQSPRPLRSDRVRKVNAEVISPKPKTSGILKMENNSLPNSSVNLDVDVLPVIAPRNSEQMENVIIVPDEQINQTEVQSPRSLRSERIRKVNPEVTSLKPKTSRIIKMENNSLLNSYIDVDDLPIISQRNLEQMENVIIVPDEQKDQTEAPSPRSLRSDRVRKVNSEVTSPKSRTSRILKIDNIRSLPTSSADQQLDVNDLHVIPQRNSDQKENVIVVPEEQKNQIEVQSPRSLRSDRIRKVNSEVTEVTSKPLPNSSTSQQLDVNDIQIISETNSEQSLTDVPQIKIERPNSSHRLLRSETIRKELPENANVSNTNIDNMITSPRLLRSEISSPRNSQNLTKEQSLSPSTKKIRTAQKSPQPCKISNTSIRVDPVKVVVIQNELLASQNFNKTMSESANGVQNTEIQKPYESSVSRKSPKSFGKHSGILAGSKKVLTSKKKKTFHNRICAPKTSMLLRSELAQLKNVANGIKPSEKKISKKKANSVVELQSKQKKKRFLKTKTVQTEDSNNISKSEKHVEIIEFKKDAIKNTTPIQSMVDSSNNHVPKTQNICQKEIPSTEATVVIEENKNPKKSPARRNKSSDILYNKNPKSEKHVQMIDFKKGAMRNSTPAQSMDVCEVSETSNSQKEITSTEATVIIEENRNPKNSPTRRNKSSDILYKNNPKSEKHVELIELKEGAIKNSTSVQNMDVCKVLETSNSQKDILSTETTVISKENKNLKNSPTRRNKSSNILYKNNSKSEKHIEIMEIKKGATKNSTPIQSLDVCEVLETSNCQKEIPCTEATVIIEENENLDENPKNSSTRRNKSSEGDVVTTENVSIKKNSPGKRKKNKRKRKLKSEEEQKTVEGHPAQHQDIQEENEKCDIISKKADITVFDFDESEPEVVPLRLNNTPKKEKSAMFTNKESIKPSEGNVTPKSKKPRVADQPTTKAQAKVQLLAVFDEGSTQINDLDIPANPDKNKTKPTPRRKTVKDQLTQEQLSCQQNENVKKKRGRPKASPNKNDTPQTSQSQDTPKNTPRTSTSPLKQTTITDMFNVMMKKEKSSVDSVFEPAPKEAPLAPRKETGNNTKTDMPPPKLDRKPAPNEEDEEYYEDDSDCESRMEWIPEEYAEYKFKYSAKKMMTYKPIHKCKICLLILPTYYKLSKHKEEHAKKQNPYNCKQCEESFSNVEDLTAHLRVHKGKHPYTCKKCDVGFWSKKSLDAHTPIHVLRKVKQPNKRFRCDVCAKEFSKLCDMERHTRVHTGEKPCICNICNKRFQQSHNLSKHLLTHLHVKPFHCEICNKQFGRNDVLNRHLLTHSVEKPIKCPLCSKGFIRQSQLNNHMKKNHLDAAKIGAPAEQVAEAK